MGKKPDWHGWRTRFWLSTWNQKDFFCSSSRKFSNAAPTDVICVVYVDDLIFWSWEVPQINQVAMKLRDLGVDLENK